ncbi:hypothetical protein [Actinosynnema sp. NPDC020468]|uniref:effector-associated constant component EACC1 n=1 Tax=Actinosynnema sp. NPDC020468 TaxID=3154488 RepID=UPI0033DFE8AC
MSTPSELTGVRVADILRVTAAEGWRMAEQGVEFVVLGEEHVLEARSLLKALRGDEVPGSAPVLRRGAGVEGDLGVVDEVLALVLSPESVAAVAGAVTTWLTTRRRAVRVRIRHKGRELEVEAKSRRDAAELLGEIKDFLDGK